MGSRVLFYSIGDAIRSKHAHGSGSFTAIVMAYRFLKDVAEIRRNKNIAGLF